MSEDHKLMPGEYIRLEIISRDPFVSGINTTLDALNAICGDDFDLKEKVLCACINYIRSVQRGMALTKVDTETHYP